MLRTIEYHQNTDRRTPRHYLTLNGQFLLGAKTLPELNNRRAQLDIHDWTFIRLDSDNLESPLDLIASVRAAGHVFSSSTSLTLSRLRSFFSGCVLQTSAPFCFMVLDDAMAGLIRAQLPASCTRDFRPTSDRAETPHG